MKDYNLILRNLRASHTLKMCVSFLFFFFLKRQSVRLHRREHTREGFHRRENANVYPDIARYCCILTFSAHRVAVKYLGETGQAKQGNAVARGGGYATSRGSRNRRSCRYQCSGC